MTVMMYSMEMFLIDKVSPRRQGATHGIANVDTQRDPHHQLGYTLVLYLACG